MLLLELKVLELELLVLVPFFCTKALARAGFNPLTVVTREV